MTSLSVEAQGYGEPVSKTGPLLQAMDEVEKLQGLFHQESSYKSSSDDMFSEEDCVGSQWYSKQEELVTCLLKMKNLMEEAELESMRLKEEKKLLTKRIGESLVTVNTEMDALRKQLHDQDMMLKEFGATSLPYSGHEIGKSSEYKSGLSVLVAEQTEQIISLQKKLLAYEQENNDLRKRIYTGKSPDDKSCENCNRLREYAGSLEVKLQKHKDLVTGKRKENKELKSEKLELLDQMKQLYGTLEDKEKELRDFIINYEQRMKASEETIRNLIADKKRVELERWNFLQKATESSERCITLKTELDNREEDLKKKEGELKVKEEEFLKLSQSNTREESMVEFFGLFGRQTSGTSKGYITSDAEDTTANLFSSRDREDAARERDSRLPNRDSFKKRPQQLTIDTNLGQDDPMLACSTPVPVSADTQYLSLGTPDLAHEDATSPKKPANGSSFVYDEFELRADRRSASTELPRPEKEKKSPIVRRASSFKRRETPRRTQSQRYERHKRPESPKLQPNDEKSTKSDLPNGVVVRRQSSMNKRPRTFHPDLFDSIQGTAVPSSPTKEAQSDMKPFQDPTPRSPLEGRVKSPREREPRSPRRKTLTGTLSRMFGKDKDKERDESGSKSPEAEVYDKWHVWDSIQRIPMPLWKSRDIIVWLEIECCMPMYAKSCAKNIKSGKVLLQLSEQDLASALCITNAMHKLKLKMALDNYRYPERRNVKLSKLDHMWIAFSWLKDCGLAQYSEVFERNLVDGRMLNMLSKKELEKGFSMTKKFHQVSFMCALQLLRKMNFDKEALNLRRTTCADTNIDLLVWTNERLMTWASSVDLKEYAENLRNTGLHGALIAYEETFSVDTMASALGIQIGKNAVYKHFVSEFTPLFKAARSKVKSEDKLKNGKQRSSGLSRSFSLRWSRRERSKRLTSSISTGNINGNPEPTKEANASEGNPVERRASRQATLL